MVSREGSPSDSTPYIGKEMRDPRTLIASRGPSTPHHLGDSRTPKRATAHAEAGEPYNTGVSSALGRLAYARQKPIEFGSGSSERRPALSTCRREQRRGPRPRRFGYRESGSPEGVIRSWRTRPQRSGYPVQRRALPEVVTAREQEQRVVMAGSLLDTPERHNRPARAASSGDG